MDKHPFRPEPEVPVICDRCKRSLPRWYERDHWKILLSTAQIMVWSIASWSGGYYAEKGALAFKNESVGDAIGDVGFILLFTLMMASLIRIGYVMRKPSKNSPS